MLAESTMSPAVGVMLFIGVSVIDILIILGMFELFLQAFKSFIRACVRKGNWIDINGREQFDPKAYRVYEDLEELIAHSVGKSLMLSKIYDKIVKEQEESTKQDDGSTRCSKELFQRFYPVGTVLHVDGKYIKLVEDAPGQNCCSTCGCCLYVSYKGGRSSFSGCSMDCKKYCSNEMRRTTVHWELCEPHAVQKQEQEQAKEQEDKTDSEVTIL